MAGEQRPTKLAKTDASSMAEDASVIVQLVSPEGDKIGVLCRLTRSQVSTQHKMVCAAYERSASAAFLFTHLRSC